MAQKRRTSVKSRRMRTNRRMRSKMNVKKRNRSQRRGGSNYGYQLMPGSPGRRRSFGDRLKKFSSKYNPFSRVYKSLRKRMGREKRSQYDMNNDLLRGKDNVGSYDRNYDPYGYFNQSNGSSKSQLEAMAAAYSSPYADPPGRPSAPPLSALSEPKPQSVFKPPMGSAKGIYYPEPTYGGRKRTRKQSKRKTRKARKTRKTRRR